MYTRKSKRDWTNEAVLLLIENWKKFPCLYDAMNRNYYEKNIRINKLNIIKEKLNHIMPSVSTSDIKEKMHNLRGQYIHELLKIKRRNNCIESDELYVPSVYWFDSMKFLDKFIKPRKTISNFKMMDWTKKLVLKLIDLWKEHECLYNSSHPLYSNKQARLESIEKITEALRAEVPEINNENVKTKINYLRSKYLQELDKTKSFETGVGSDHVHMSTSYWFKPLEFLNNHVKPRKRKSNNELLPEPNIVIDDNQAYFQNKNGEIIIKECGTIFWTEYQEDIFRFRCKFCNAWFNKNDEFFKHIQIHRKETIFIDNLNKDSYEEIEEKIEFTDFRPETHNCNDEVCDIFPCNEKNLNILQESQNLDENVQNNFELFQTKDIKIENSYDFSDFELSEATKNNQNKCDTGIDSDQEDFEVNVKPTDYELNKTTKNNQNKSDISVLNDQEDLITENKKVCRFCGQFFSTTCGRKEHERLHTGETPYSCQFCSAKFRISRQLKNHSQLCMQNPNRVSRLKRYDKERECDKCGKIFKNTANFHVHKRRHDGITKFPCTYCEKKFYTTTERTTHERIHTRVFPYLCTTCGKGFRSCGHLTIHLRRHKEEKLYKCQICEKEFYSSSMLRDHTATHSNLKPFKCDACDAAFATKKGRKQHMKLHDEIGKYSCTICNKIFKQYSGLYSHLKIHNVENLKEHIHKIS